MPVRPFLRLPAAIALLGACACAFADEVPRERLERPALDLSITTGPKTRFDGLIGVSVQSAAEYLGADRRELSVRPLAAIRFGRLRLATSGSGGLLDFGAEADAAGASYDLVQSDRWRLRTGLRLTGGRSSASSAELAGIPNVRKTLLGRASITYTLTPRWRLGATLSADLLGRDDGFSLTSGVDYRRPIAARTELQWSAGVTIANATHMASYYGVPGQASTENRPAYAPGGGPKDAGIGLALTTALDGHWVAFGSLRYSRLLGNAVDSPLALRHSDVSATLGVAWRCCRP